LKSGKYVGFEDRLVFQRLHSDFTELVGLAWIQLRRESDDPAVAAGAVPVSARDGEPALVAEAPVRISKLKESAEVSGPPLTS